MQIEFPLDSARKDKASVLRLISQSGVANAENKF